jgi:hypothetical protein
VEPATLLRNLISAVSIFSSYFLVKNCETDLTNQVILATSLNYARGGGGNQPSPENVVFSRF